MYEDGTQHYDQHGRSYHRVLGARAHPSAAWILLKQSSQREIYNLKLNFQH